MAEGMSLRTVIGAFIGIGFVIIIGFFVIPSLIKTQLPAKIDDATMSSFDEIVSVIESIKAEEITEKEIIVDINEPFAIIGFSKGEDEKNSGKYPYYRETFINFITKLKSPCLGKSCLCICDGADESGRAVLVEDDCLSYKDKCVYFDNIVDYFKGPFVYRKEFALGPWVKPRKILITGNEGTIIVEDNYKGK